MNKKKNSNGTPNFASSILTFNSALAEVAYWGLLRDEGEEDKRERGESPWPTEKAAAEDISDTVQEALPIPKKPREGVGRWERRRIIGPAIAGRTLA